MILHGYSLFANYFLSGEAERLVIAKFVTVAALGCFSGLSLSAGTGVIMQSQSGIFPMISKALREIGPASKALRKTRSSSRLSVLLLVSICGL